MSLKRVGVFLLLLIIIFFLTYTKKDDTEVSLPVLEDSTSSVSINFKTAFEPSEVVDSLSSSGDLVLDFKAPNFIPNLWLKDNASMPLYFEGGTILDRRAELTDDPENESNKVLRFWIKNAVIPDYLTHKKGRIQNCFPFNQMGPNDSAIPVPELYMKESFYLPTDWNLLLNYPSSKDSWWLSPTLQEFGMGGDWEGHRSPARIAVAISPDFSARVFRIGAAFDKKDPGDSEFVNYWTSIASTYPLPIGEWFTMEIFYKMGNVSTGRFILTIKKNADLEPTTLVDVTNFTYAPGADTLAGVGPVPLTNWCPQKLYVSDNVIDFIRESGGLTQVYFDDFQFTNKWPDSRF